MKKITKLLALVLALALVFSLTACAKQATITGSWKYVMDMSKVLESAGMMDEADGSGMYTAEQLQAIKDAYGKIFEGLNLTMILDLKEDGTYTMDMDEASQKAAADTLSARLPEVLPELFAAMLGISVDELPAALETLGMSMDDLTNSEEYSAEEMLGDFSSETEKGTYTFEEGKLVLTPEDGDVVTMTVELSATELKVTAFESKDEEEAEVYKAMLPMVFVR